MRWVFLTLGSLAAVCSVACTAPPAAEAPAGIEFAFGEVAECTEVLDSVGSFQIEGMDRRFSARAELSAATQKYPIRAPPGLYSVNFVPPPERPALGVVGPNPLVVVVAPRAFTRVVVRAVLRRQEWVINQR